MSPCVFVYSERLLCWTNRQGAQLKCLIVQAFWGSLIFFDRVPLASACEVTFVKTHISRWQGSLSVGFSFLFQTRCGWPSVHSLSLGQCNTSDVCIKQNQSLWFADNKHPSNSNEQDVIWQWWMVIPPYSTERVTYFGFWCQHAVLCCTISSTWLKEELIRFGRLSVKINV